MLSWYEQKAVCILLTLLALGVKNIYLGPTLPAFLSETVVKTLVETYDLHPVSYTHLPVGKSVRAASAGMPSI